MYVTADPDGPPREAEVHSAASQVVALEARATRRRGPRSMRPSVAATTPIATFKQQYPATLQFAYGTPKYEKPFFVRSIWHDGKFTYIKSDARELPALYELADGRPALVNFQVQGKHLRRAEGARTRLSRARQRAVRLPAGTVAMADGTRRTAATVTDNRTAPRGVMPRGTQTWLMAGWRLVILAIIVFTGRPAPAHASQRRPRARTALAPSPDRLREYQDRLRALDERAGSKPSRRTPTSASRPARSPIAEPRRAAPAPDAIQQDAHAGASTRASSPATWS